MEDNGPGSAQLLVARHGLLCSGVCEGLQLCNCTKTFPALHRMMMPIRVPDCHWQIILVDLIMELPQSQGYDAIMVVVDRLSKRAHIIPTTSDVMASGVARLFRDHVWKLHGLPEEVISA